MKLKKVLPAAAVLVGTTIGSIGGYYYREAQTSPALQSLSAALELVTGREAKAQAAYESAQGKLAVLQETVLVQEELHRKQLVTIHGLRERAELTLRPALAESKRKVVVAEAVPIPPPVIIPADPDDLEAHWDYVADLKTSSAAWKHLAIVRQDAIEGLRITQTKLMDVNKALKIEVKQEQVLRATVERDRNLWKERYTIADKRVGKLKGSRLKWTLGVIAGAAAGIYLTGR